MKTKFLIIPLLAMAAIGAAPVVQNNRPCLCLKSVTVTDRRGKSFDLARLLPGVRDYLEQKAPETRTNSDLEVAASVDCSRRTTAVSFYFVEKPGSRVYRVECDTDGHVLNFESHVGTDVLMAPRLRK